MKLVNANVDQIQVFVIINNVGIIINASVNAKNWLTKEYVIQDLFGNPSNCECECDKLCDVGEYLDYANCKCRKRLIDSLAEECTENVEEVNLAKINSTELHSAEDENKCNSSCTIYVILIAIIFTMCVGIGTYFVQYKYMNHDKKTARRYDYVYQATNY